LVLNEVTFEFIITSTKIAAFIFILFAASELWWYNNHDIALNWGLYSMAALGVKNAAQAYTKK